MSKIAIVGCDGSGKTVLVSSLSDYYKAGRRPNQSCIMVPANSSTRRYVDNLHRVMRIDHKWPQATNDIVGGSALSWNMLRGGRPLTEVQLMDFGGENFRYAFRDDGPTANPEVVSKLKAYIQAADFVIITVGLDKLVRNLTPDVYGTLDRGDIEYDRDSEAQWVTEGLLKMVAPKLEGNPPGVVVALTQADKHADVLREFGGAKGLFARCWPEISTMYPTLNVVSVASIDRMTDDGMPAAGYRTDGVLSVMKEFSRFAFGDPDDLCARMDSEANLLNEAAAATDDPQGFLSAVLQFRTRLEELRDGLALVDELYRERLAGFESLLESFGEREKTLRNEVERQFRAAAAEALQRKTAKGGRPPDASAAPDARGEAAPTASRKAPSRALFAFATVFLLGALAYLGLTGHRLWTAGRPDAAQTDAGESERIAQTNLQAKAAEEAAKRAAEEEARRKAQEEARRKAEAEEAARRKAEEEVRKAEERARAAKEAAEQARTAAAAAEKARIAAAAEKARIAAVAAAKAKAAAEAAAAPQNAQPRQEETMTRDEFLRRRAEDRENKYNELRERLRSEADERMVAGYFENLVDSVNHGMLERGRNLIASLSGRKMTELQTNKLEYAVTFMDQLEKAQNGNGDAMVWIGNQYYTSPNALGVIKNPTEAHAWYQRAAAIGSAQAYYFLSLLAEEGIGCRRNESLAGRYCLKAARLGSPDAMFWTGVYFMDGKLGFENSPSTAYKFFMQAKEAGFRNPSLDRLIKRTEAARDDETVDGRYPDDPRQDPEPPPAEDGGHWWGLGIF